MTKMEGSRKDDESVYPLSCKEVGRNPSLIGFYDQILWRDERHLIKGCKSLSCLRPLNAGRCHVEGGPAKAGYSQSYTMLHIIYPPYYLPSESKAWYRWLVNDGLAWGCML
ncbi:hypothetical protein MASR2M48_15270 [Spirochaetota bacterium]